MNGTWAGTMIGILFLLCGTACTESAGEKQGDALPIAPAPGATPPSGPPAGNPDGTFGSGQFTRPEPGAEGGRPASDTRPGDPPAQGMPEKAISEPVRCPIQFVAAAPCARLHALPMSDNAAEPHCIARGEPVAVMELTRSFAGVKYDGTASYITRSDLACDRPD